MNQPQKKPVRAEGLHLHCYCGHIETAHPCKEKGCDCAVFQPRPCMCGHPYHAGACQECRLIQTIGLRPCRAYAEDRSPEFILRQGLRSGDWRIDPIARLQFWMRPGKDPLSRVWACCMLHVSDRKGKKRNQGRLATMLNDAGNPVPLSPEAILHELNALDSLARLDRHGVRKVLRELERMGSMRVAGHRRGEVRILLYARPLPSRELPSIPDLGVYPDPQNLVSPTDDRYLREKVILPLRRSLVKMFSRAVRQCLEAGGGTPGLGVCPDPQNLIAEAVDEAILGVQSAYQKVLLGVCTASGESPREQKEKPLAEAPVHAAFEDSGEVIASRARASSVVSVVREKPVSSSVEVLVQSESRSVGRSASVVEIGATSEERPTDRPIGGSMSPNPLKPKIREWLEAHVHIPGFALEEPELDAIAATMRTEEHFEQFQEAALRQKNPRGWKVYVTIALRCTTARPGYERAKKAGGNGQAGEDYWQRRVRRETEKGSGTNA